MPKTQVNECPGLIVLGPSFNISIREQHQCAAISVLLRMLISFSGDCLAYLVNRDLLHAEVGTIVHGEPCEAVIITVCSTPWMGDLFKRIRALLTTLYTMK